jgi:hypothetical protein
MAATKPKVLGGKWPLSQAAIAASVSPPLSGSSPSGRTSSSPAAGRPSWMPQSSTSDGALPRFAAMYRSSRSESPRHGRREKRDESLPGLVPG